MPRFRFVRTRRAAEFRPPDLGEPGGIVSFHQVRRLIDDAGGCHVPIAAGVYLAAHDDDRQRLAYVVKVGSRGRSGTAAVVAVEYTPSHIYMLRRPDVWHRAFRFRIANYAQMEVAGGVWMEMREVRDGDRIAVNPSGYVLADHTEHEGGYEALPPFVCRSLGLNPPEPLRATEADAQAISAGVNTTEWPIYPADVAWDSVMPTPSPDSEAERERVQEWVNQVYRSMMQFSRTMNNQPPQGDGSE